MLEDEIKADPLWSAFAKYMPFAQQRAQDLTAAVAEMQAVVGPEAIGVLSAIYADPELAIVRMDTNNHEIARLTERHVTRTNLGNSAPALQELARQLARPLAIYGEIVAAGNAFVDSCPSGAVARQMIREAAALPDWATHRARIASLLVVNPERSVDVAGVGLAQRAADDFSAQARSLCQVAATHAETEYKPSLQAMLTVSRLLSWSTERRANGVDTPNLLGRLVDQCRAVWSQGATDLLRLLSDDLVMCRNSEMHRSTRRDIDTKTITFINEEGSKSAGPFSLERVGLIMFDSMAIVSLVRSAFRSEAGLP